MTLFNIDEQLNQDTITLHDSEINSFDASKLAEKLAGRSGFFLDLSSNPILEKGGLAVAKLKAKGLGLAKTFITNNVAKELFTNWNLSSLNLKGNRITDAAFATVDCTKMSNLHALDLSQTEITDATLGVLMKLPNLRILVVDQNNLSSDAITQLLKKPSLCYLQAGGCKLDDKTNEAIDKFNENNAKKTARFIQREHIVFVSSSIDFFNNKTCSPFQ